MLFIDISIKEPGLTFNSFLKDLISEMMLIIFSTCSVLVSLLISPIGQLANIKKSLLELSNLFFKKLGRINNILSDDLDKPAATMVVSGDLFKIYFDKDVDLKLIKENLTSKQNRIQEEMNKISQRLENKSFVDRAPKEIVEQEKTNYNNLKNDIDKISVTIKGI